MEIYRFSPVTGQLNVRQINCTQEQYDAWQNGTLIQNAMPSISKEDREFIISGCTPDDWHTLYGTCT